MVETINERSLKDPEFDQSGVCPKCSEPLRSIEDCSGVQQLKVFDPKTKIWKFDGENYYGDTTMTYECTNCEWKSNEEFTDGDYGL